MQQGMQRSSHAAGQAAVTDDGVKQAHRQRQLDGRHKKENQEAKEKASCHDSLRDPALRRDICLANQFHIRVHTAGGAVWGGAALGFGKIWYSEPNCSKNSTVKARIAYDIGSSTTALI